MTKDELLLRLKGCEWNDFEVKEASGGLPKSMWETVGVIYPLAVKSGQNEVVRKGGRINNDSDGLGADRQAYISANSGQNEVVRKSGRIQGRKPEPRLLKQCVGSLRSHAASLPKSLESRHRQFRNMLSFSKKLK